MKLDINIIEGTATAEFENYPTPIIKMEKQSIEEHEVSKYKRAGFDISYDLPDFRRPYIYKSKTIGYEWDAYLAEMDDLWVEIKVCESRGIGVTNFNEFKKVYDKNKREYRKIKQISVEQAKHDSIMRVLAKQDVETLIALVDTAHWHLTEHYLSTVNGYVTIPQRDQKVLDLKDKVINAIKES